MRSRTSCSWRSVSARCWRKAPASGPLPASRGARRIWISACSSIECASARYLSSCSWMSLVGMRAAYPRRDGRTRSRHPVRVVGRPVVLALAFLAVLPDVAGTGRPAPRPAVELRGVGSAPMAFGGPTGRRALTDWSVGGRRVRAPFAVDARRLEMRAFDGSAARFSTAFELPAAGTYAIRFESVNHAATVWLDGRRLGRHSGAYLPFEVRAHLGAGPHRLVVRADWRHPLRMRAEGWHRTWFNFGGLAREVTIRRLRAPEPDPPRPP